MTLFIKIVIFTYSRQYTIFDIDAYHQRNEVICSFQIGGTTTTGKYISTKNLLLKRINKDQLPVGTEPVIRRYVLARMFGHPTTEWVSTHISDT